MPFRTGYVNHDIEAGFPTSPMPQSLPEILCTPEDDAILRQQIQQIDGDKVQRVAILSFRGLQLYRIAKLQAELVKKQNAMMNPGTEVPEKEPDASDQREKDRQVDELLQRYADAVRNYETLSQTIEFKENLLYEFLGGKQEFKVIKRANDNQWNVPLWLARITPPSSTLIRYSVGPLGFRELDKGRLSQRRILGRIKSRLHMAVLGGVALIAPVLLMTLKPTLVVNLVTASISTMIFAVIMVIFAADASGKDVLASTAAYAAVMVVFIETSLQAYA
ncbi:hypothetical protein F4820DRAFT_427783 [Hypoxylon rubiginosum]|uniref:Uncharacterized protein n=1 Tax=Hypoxylon rubiginosum TaxID=110542 RepID=A0ACB9YVI6_9PEZI|nr:hypothetical protein F4820DRAFT_427783 [Hypoxylon rubiginosum]